MTAVISLRKMSGAPGYWKIAGRIFYEGGSIMKIITISREFGSGGRELGKRLGDTKALIPGIAEYIRLWFAQN